MKNVLFCMIILFSALFRANGQMASETDLRTMDDFINSKITIEKEKLDPETLSKVFKGAFYKLTPTYHHDNGTASCEEYKVVLIDGKVSDLEELSETKSLNLLYSLLRQDYLIKNESDAKIFETALDILYPMDWSDDAEDKKLMQKDGKWVFLRGDFFGSKKGFVVTVDENFKISEINYDLEIIKPEQ